MYSEKQKQLLRLFKQKKLRRINILHGSVRSGKTWISLVLWAFWLLTMPKNGAYLMVAKTLTSLRRNCLDLLETLVGKANFSYSLAAKQAFLFGRLVYLEGVNDARAESKIRGMTLQGAYCDELTLFTQDFFAMLLSRLSMPGAKLFGTTNPDNPGHWLKTDYLDRAGELDLMKMRFTIDDNEFLDPEYVRQLKREYTGVFYDRFILGNWVVAEGLVYPIFSEKEHVVHVLPECCAHPEKGQGEYYISVDYGTKNPFSAGLWCVSGGEATRIAEYYYDGRKSKRPRTDEEHYAALEKLARREVWDRGKRVVEAYPIQCVVIDPSAASMIECIRRHGSFSVRAAKNDVIPGIGVTGSLLAAGKLKIHADCKDCIREFGVYSWDEKAKGDQVIKENDHAMDDIRYFCYTVLRRLFRWDDWKQVENVS